LINTFNLFEVKAREVGFTVETSHVWTYGEGCECGCKWMVLHGITIVAHCKTIKQVSEAIAAERRDIMPMLKENQQTLAVVPNAIELNIQVKQSNNPYR
jgi:hypothetical protein